MCVRAGASLTDAHTDVNELEGLVEARLDG